jgi:2-iminobutanoate/2-iminopropanoate deaminase
MKIEHSPIRKWSLTLAAFAAVFVAGSLSAQNRAVDFTQGMPFSNGSLAGNKLYVAGQQGPDAQGR